MSIKLFRHSITRVAGPLIKYTALTLTLAIVVGCSNRQNNPKADIHADSDVATQPAVQADNEAATDQISEATVDTSTIQNTAQDTTNSATTSEVSGDTPLPYGQGEPGYVGYPLMGETGTGEVIRYISSAPLDCSGPSVVSGCDHAITVNFIQTNPADPYKVLDGRAVAKCDRNVLAEVILDEDLIAYELKEPDAAMAQLLDYTCETARTSGLINTQTTAPTVPDGLAEGTPYPEVRTRLMEAGWTPKTVQMDHYTSLEQDMYDRGYTEVLGCSGTGLCRFEFGHQNTDSHPTLVVITAFADSDIYYEGDPLLRSAGIDSALAEYHSNSED